MACLIQCSALFVFCFEERLEYILLILISDPYPLVDYCELDKELLLLNKLSLAFNYYYPVVLGEFDCVWYQVEKNLSCPHLVNF
jgi:hypothetical protein